MSLGELRLIGRPHLLCAGQRTDLPDTLPSYLLVYLGTRADWMGREELASLFWPEASSEDAQRSLRVALHRLRSVLVQWGGDAQLETERRRLRWNGGSDRAQAQAARRGGCWAELGVWAGQGFAEGLTFRGLPVVREWAEGERRDWLALVREALLRGALQEEPAQTEELCARQLALDPGDEDLLRARLHALAAQGRHAELSQVFADFSARLQAELGLQPSAALVAELARLLPSAAAPQRSAGRHDDPVLLEARACLAAARCLTLQGLGGVGKTRLARALADTSTAPVLWLALQDVGSLGELLHRLRQVLGKGETPSRDAEAEVSALLAERFDAATPGLLVLDSAEHLLQLDGEGLRRLIDAWLQVAPGLRVLATSRQALGGAQEQLLALRPLAVPPQNAGAEGLDSPALRLLVDVARQSRPDFDARAQAAALMQIARQVGGLPLALRLAGTWLRLLSPSEVLAALRQDVAALDADDGSGLGISLWRSWRLLDGAAQQILASLSLFVSPFGLDDAAALADAPLARVAALVDQGLLEAQGGEADQPARWQLHPLVRAFAAVRLAEQAAWARPARERHAQAVRQRLLVWANWRLVDQRQALLTVGGLLPEARAVWERALSDGRADLIADIAVVLCNHFERSGRLADGLVWCEGVEPVFDEELPAERAALAAVARGKALLLHRSGRYAEAETLARRAQAWAHSLGHREGQKVNANTLGLALWMQGRLDAAQAALAHAQALAVEDGDRLGQAVFGGNLGLIAKQQGRFAEAEAAWRSAAAVHRELGNAYSLTLTLNNLGKLLLEDGRFEEAQALLEDSLRVCDAHGFSAQRLFPLQILAELHLRAGRLDAAQTLAEQAQTSLRQQGDRVLVIANLLFLAELARRRERLPLAAEHLAEALRAARSAGDVANLLEGLAGYGRWARSAGLLRQAEAVCLSLLSQPALNAPLRRELQDEAAQLGLALPTQPAVDADLTALVERALAALETAVSEASSLA
ncbi:tetratricopeptide repeat protein [Paucibacter sp. AS339]|uniref:tetratricopeptide repeat protein n=1 Tax=Paucibacter hankyongi TaxID=3133434 RepID=UPI00309FFA68